MVGTLPEAGLVVFAIDVALWVAAPPPFTTFTVYEVIFDILPSSEGFPQCIFIAKILIDVHPAYHVLGLYPPMAVGINVACVEVGLVNHRTVSVQSFLRCLGNHPYHFFHLAKQLLVAQHQGSLVQQP